MSTNPDRTAEFVRLFAENERVIYKQILTLLPDGAAAQEVFQECSVTLWRKFEEFEPGTLFRAWACKIAYYEVLKYRQTQRRDRLRFDDRLLEQLADERTAALDRLDERRRALKECLEKLRPSDRELVQRRYEHERTIRDLADETGRSVNILYKSLDRIRRELYRCVERSSST